MKAIHLIIAIFFVYSCDKDESSPKWITEDLNYDYTIQFPSHFEGNGFYEGNKFLKLNPCGYLIINHALCSNYEIASCVGDTINEPLPEEILKRPSIFSIDPWFYRNKEIFMDNSNIKAILYSIDELPDADNTIEGILYWNVSVEFVSIARFVYNEEQFDTVKMIINTIKRK